MAFIGLQDDRGYIPICIKLISIQMVQTKQVVRLGDTVRKGAYKCKNTQINISSERIKESGGLVSGVASGKCRVYGLFMRDRTNHDLVLRWLYSFAVIAKRRVM